jgi:predicted dehydrogenase
LARIIKIGLVGFGSWGRRHLDALRGISSFKFVGFYDPRFVGSDRRCADSLSALLNKCDAVDIATSPKALAPTAIAALRAGKDCLVEKPCATSFEEAKRLFVETVKSGRIVMPGFIEQFNPAFQCVRYILRSNPLHMFCQRSGTPTLVGKETGVIRDLAIHDLHLLRIMFGDPLRISIYENEDRTFGSIQARYRSFSASIVVDCLGPAKIRRWIVETPRDVITMHWNNGWQVSRNTQLLHIDRTLPLNLELGYFARCLIEERPPSPSICDAVRVHELIDLGLRYGSD